MGSDGHTASLFPDTAAVDEASRWVVPNWVPKLDAWRMTMTYPLLNAAREVDFVVTGADKAAAVAAVRDGPGDVPAARVEAGRTVWYVDRAAAGSGEPAASGEASGRSASG
jgi:6-phosphogluconolactonase